MSNNIIYKVSTRTQILLMHLKIKKETAFGQSLSVTQEVATLSNKKKGMLLKNDIILCIR